MSIDRFASRFGTVGDFEEGKSSLSQGQLLRQLEMLISEASHKIRVFAEGRTDDIRYIREFRNRIQHCLLDIGQLAKDELHEIATLELTISDGLKRYYDAGIFNDFEVKNGDPSDFQQLQNEYNQAMPSKIQQIIMLLNQVRDKMLNPIPTTTPDRLIRPFPTPEGSTWADVLIRFTSDFQVQIYVCDHPETRTYIEMGFEDGRRGRQSPKPDQNWEVLRVFAEQDGTICSTNEAGEWGKLEKRVQTINTRLKKLLGFPANPIEYDRKAKAYKSKVRLIPPGV